MAEPLVKEQFSEEDFTHSDKAIQHNIDNSVSDPTILINLQQLQNFLWQVILVVRAKTGIEFDIILDCAYRCLTLNGMLAGAASKSEHMKGKAADCVPKGMTVAQFFEILKELAREGTFVFGQVICERNTWIHISTANPFHNDFMISPDGLSYTHVTL